MLYERHFTLNEANALLPWARRLLCQAAEIIATLPPGRYDHTPEEAAEQAACMRGSAFDYERALQSGGSAWLRDAARLDEEALLNLSWRALPPPEKQNLADMLLYEVISRGIVIQDVERALIDFPSLAEGEEIMLCYELTDGPHIIAWHRLETGFAGRRSIRELPE